MKYTHVGSVKRQRMKYFFFFDLFSYSFNATDDDIRRAYRKIVLKHHPDKRKAQGEEIRQEDDYFTCITKAYETLGNESLVQFCLVAEC